MLTAAQSSCLQSKSLSGFVLIKAVVNNQNNVRAAAEEGYNPLTTRYALSAYMGEPQTWYTYKNQKYHFTIKHPITWIAPQKTQTTLPNALDKYQVFLGDKINLQATVYKTYSIPDTSKKIKLGSSTFYLVEDKPNLKSAVVEKNKLFYKIELAEHNFFSNAGEFRSGFYLILKNFEFLES